MGIRVIYLTSFALSVLRVSAIGSCPGNKYPCDNSDVCVGVNKMCDGSADCARADDEKVTRCEQHCQDISRWWCSRRRTCLKYTQLCDGVDECVNPNRVALDEKPTTCKSIPCTGKYTRCGSMSLQCIKNNKVCDETEHCLNGWDELSCNQAQCSLSGDYNDTFPLATPLRELSGETICRAALETHNKLRRYHQDTDDLRYDVTLAQTAEERAMSFAHNYLNLTIHEGRDIPIDNHHIPHLFNIGEVSYIGLQIINISTTYISEVIYQRYNQSIDCHYNYGNGTHDIRLGCGLGGFRQILWADNVYMGCGAASVPFVLYPPFVLPEAYNENPRIIFIVCHYLVQADPEEFDGYIKPLINETIYPLMPYYPLIFTP